jgi:membrane protein YdbS with pleckstrin-like domain
MRATRVPVAVGLLLAVGGGVMLWRGAAEGPAGLTVAGILVLLAGLVCLRIVYWRVRVAAMTRAGLALHGPDGRDGEH